MAEPLSSLPFPLETELERRIGADPEWRAGLEYGRPRPGHPEGAVVHHVADVLANVDRFYGNSPLRERLRLIALIHDTFKYRVDPARPRSGENHHAAIARRFSERYISDPSVLAVIELHDEAYNAGRRETGTVTGAAPKNARGRCWSGWWVTWNFIWRSTRAITQPGTNRRSRWSGSARSLSARRLCQTRLLRSAGGLSVRAMSE